MRAIGFLCLAAYIVAWGVGLSYGIGAWSNRRAGEGLFGLQPRYTRDGTRLRTRAVAWFVLAAGLGVTAFLLLAR